MPKELAELSIRGKFHQYPAAHIDHLTVIVLGRWVKTAVIKDEGWIPSALIGDHNSLIEKVKKKKIGADIFHFCQKLPDLEPRYPYPVDWQNVAAIPITDYADWWDHRATQVTRKNVRRAARRGIEIKTIEFSDELINGIVRINSSSKIRRRRQFTHYGKSFDEVKKDYSDFLDRSEYLGAYFQGELVGILRLIYLGDIASVLQLLCMNQYSDKRPANALIARAVEICVERKMQYLAYGQYIYGENVWDHLVEFKRRNGFERFDLPAYFVPLTVKGRISIMIRVHKGLKGFLPRPLLRAGFRLRKWIQDRGAGPPPKEES